MDFDRRFEPVYPWLRSFLSFSYGAICKSRRPTDNCLFVSPTIFQLRATGVILRNLLCSVSTKDNNKAIEEVSCDRTVIVIAHRLSTIEKADNMVVLYGAKVVEQGTEEELLSYQGTYWSLYQAQSLSNHQVFLSQLL